MPIDPGYLGQFVVCVGCSDSFRATEATRAGALRAPEAGGYGVAGPEAAPPKPPPPPAPPVRPPIEEQGREEVVPPAAGEGWICPGCGREVALDLSECPTCGTTRSGERGRLTGVDLEEEARRVDRAEEFARATRPWYLSALTLAAISALGAVLSFIVMLTANYRMGLLCFLAFAATAYAFYRVYREWADFWWAVLVAGVAWAFVIFANEVLEVIRAFS